MKCRDGCRQTRKAILELIELTKRDAFAWRRYKLCIFTAIFDGWEIEADWERGEDPELYLDGVRIDNCVSEIKELYEAIRDQQKRLKPHLKTEQEKAAAQLLRDINRYHKKRSPR